MSGPRTARPAIADPAPTRCALAGLTHSLGGHRSCSTKRGTAAEGHFSPQAKRPSAPIGASPAGSMTAQPAKVDAPPTPGSLAGPPSPLTTGSTT